MLKFLVPLYTFGFLILGAKITAGLFIFHVVIAPLIFKYSKTFQRSLIFSNFVQYPFNVDFDNPSASDVEGGRNLSIEYQSKVDNCRIKIGIWHILPTSVYERLKGKLEDVSDKEQLNALFDSELVNSKTPIMLYCHGNSNSRATGHRVLLYKFFQRMNYHTIAFDYRGYGDSSPVSPSEDGVVEDLLMVYDWLVTTIAKGAQPPPVFVWGHSLGTGISSHMFGNLEDLSKNILERSKPLPPPKGLILESPFNNLSDEIKYHLIAKLLVTWLPYFHSCFVSPFGVRQHAFRSDQHLARARGLPLMILHAKDDIIVPYKLGEMLHKSVLESRSDGGAAIIFHSFEKSENLGHKMICDAKNLDKIVGDFVLAHQ